ncbi:MAG: hypothetical protein ACRCXB_23830 [Aeromonadaceae bacterium]
MKQYGKGLGLWQDKRPQEPAPITEFRDVPVYLDEPKPVSQEIPVINMEQDRIYSIIHNTPAIFKIENNPKANPSKPLMELSVLNPIDSGKIYDDMGKKYGLDPGWLKAIAYMENTHGFYDGLPPINLVNTSYRPMNVQYKTWKPLADQLGFSEFQVQYRVEANVELAAMIIKRIAIRVPNPTLEKVASIYNFTGSEQTRDYGARVQQIYSERLWEK